MHRQHGSLNDFTVWTADQEHLPWTINVDKTQILEHCLCTSIQYHDPTIRINEHYFHYVQRAKTFSPFLLLVFFCFEMHWIWGFCSNLWIKTNHHGNSARATVFIIQRYLQSHEPHNLSLGPSWDELRLSQASAFLSLKKIKSTVLSPFCCINLSRLCSYFVVTFLHFVHINIFVFHSIVDRVLSLLHRRIELLLAGLDYRIISPTPIKSWSHIVGLCYNKTLKYLDLT